MMKAKIFEIKRFAVHDGDGIRTTVFFKGCPLKCLWCHNPESIDFRPELAYYENKCTGCGKCASVCPSGAHGIKAGHIFEREKCISCGVCADTCYANALTFYGKDASAKELIPILLEDKDFYDNSGGGVTLSGGECLIQADFCAELLKQLKENGIHTAVDTCGFVPRENIDKVIPYTDIFLYDIKAIDEDVHIKCTGRSNKLILENLIYLNSLGKAVEIRIPYVPDYNDGQIEKIADFLAQLNNITKIRVLPYHNYAGSKYEALRMENKLPKKLPTDENIQAVADTIKQITNLTVII